MDKEKKKGKHIFSWMFSIFCMMGCLVYAPSVAAVLFLLAGILTLPIRRLQDLIWNKLPLKKWMRVCLVGVLFFWAVGMAPSVESTAEPTNLEITATPEPTVTPEPTATPKPTVTPEPTATPKPTVTPKPTATPKLTVTPEPTATPKLTVTPEDIAQVKTKFSIKTVPDYTTEAYIAVNNNEPYFSEDDLSITSFEYYSPLDNLGRCGVCVANVGLDIMPTEERGSIGAVKPTGWNQAKYAGLVDGNYLYNRCHLIGYQLTGENANTENLITGTRYLNIEGMLPFENMIADYVKETGNHVLYRVTPIFEGNNLLASGVLMEAISVEDEGDGILFCVYAYNVQPGVTIDYSDGASKLTERTEVTTEDKETQQVEQTTATTATTAKYAVNAKNGKIHMVGECSATGDGSNAMSNPVYFTTYEEAEAYSISIAPEEKKRKCGNCW